MLRRVPRSLPSLDRSRGGSPPGGGDASVGRRHSPPTNGTAGVDLVAETSGRRISSPLGLQLGELKPLAEVLPSSLLTPAEMVLIIRQAQVVLDQLYAHLPLK